MSTVISPKDNDNELLEKLKNDTVFQLDFDLMSSQQIDDLVDGYHQYEADDKSNHKNDFSNTNYGYKLVDNDDVKRAILTLNNDVFVDQLKEYYESYNIPSLDYNFPDSFKNNLYQLYHHMYAMIRRMLMLISKDTFGDVNYLQRFVSKENFVMVVNYYFAVKMDGNGDVVCKRFDDHFDFSLVTITLSDDYQHKEFNFEFLKDEKWQSMDNHDHKFTVFYGMLMEILTAGKYKALKHRTLTNGKNRDRFMIGFFAQPDEDKQLEICDEHAPLLEGYDYDHYNREISYNNFMRETMCSQLLDVDTE